MKKLIAVVFVGLMVFLIVYRQRVYLRDPLGSVLRDGVKLDAVKVMINYTNDVLVDDASGGRRRIYLVQNWNRVAGYPSAPLECINGMACMTDADQASASPLQVGSRGRRSPFEGVTMTNRRVEFVDEDGALVVVVLR